MAFIKTVHFTPDDALALVNLLYREYLRARRWGNWNEHATAKRMLKVAMAQTHYTPEVDWRDPDDDN